MTFEGQVDPQAASYYTNLTGFWRGDVNFHNLTKLEVNATTPPPPWHRLADELVASANLTNATEFASRVGSWNWTRSNKVQISLGDKLMWDEAGHRNLTKDIAMVHVSYCFWCTTIALIDFGDARARSTSQTQRVQKS